MTRTAHRQLSTIALALSIAVSLAACGTDEATTSPEATPPKDSTPPVDSTSSTDESYSTDSDVAVVRVGDPDFLPTIVIGGDEWAYTPSELNDGPQGFGGGVAPAAAPAPPEPTPMERRQLTPAGMEIVLDRAAELGLLAVPDEYADPQVTDVGSTFVSFIVGAGTFEHEAYALGVIDESGNRKNLADFVADMDDLESLVGGKNIGPAEPYVPSKWVVTSRGSYETDGYEVTWPAAVPVEDGCIELPIAEFAEGVAGTYIADVDGQLIRVSVLPVLPGDGCD
jgi:hypothetical protein